jgi:hypothetical protein
MLSAAPSEFRNNAMSSAVHSLQKGIATSQKSLTQLFREAKLIAGKLGLNDIETWVDREMKGYPPNLQPPEYRAYTSYSIEVRNPMRGWGFAGHFAEKFYSHEPISAVEDLSKSGEMLTMTLARQFAVRDSIGGSMGANWPQRVTIPASEYKNIVEAVKNELLQWSLELEKRGIKGDDMNFDEKEKQAAVHQTFNIQKLTGVAGNVTNSQVAVYDYGTVHQVLKDLNVPQAQRNELENILDELKAAPAEKKPPLLDRGKAWLARNKDVLGATAEIVARVLGAS